MRVSHFNRSCSHALLVAALIAGCQESAAKREPAKVTVSVAPLGISGGAVPVPIDPVSKKVRWDASYADLLAADALATCYDMLPMSQQPLTTARTTVGYRLLAPWARLHYDAYISYLIGKMDAALCTAGRNQLSSLPSNYSSHDAIYRAWITNRADSTCNGDAAAPSTPKTIDISPPAGANTLIAYLLPTLPAMAAAGRTVTGRDSQEVAAYRNVQDEALFAPLNLCIAERMRERLDSEQIVFASQDELAGVQEVMRQRYLVAVYQYTALVRALQQWNTTSTMFTVDSPMFYAPVISAWYMTMPAGTMPVIAQDFARAISRLTETTTALADQLLRSPAAGTFGRYRPDQGGPFNRYPNGDTDLGMLGGPRVDVLGALYGFQADPLTHVLAPAVTVDMSAPEVGVLLGLGRAANAFNISGSSNAIDTGASARSLLDAVEVYLRAQECPINSSYCSGPLPASRDDYLAARRYGVKLPHAETLISALTELIFGRPRGHVTSEPPQSSAVGELWAYHGLVLLPHHIRTLLSGTHTYTGDFTTIAGGTLHLDPKFMPKNTASIWDWQTMDMTVWRDFDPYLVPTIQGFSAGEVASSLYYATDAVPHLRLGSIPALIGAR